MEAKIQTLHPDETKSGVNISREKYEIIKSAIVEALSATPELSFRELTKSVEEELAGRFDGSIPWYVITVKLDLEARGVVERIPTSGVQQLRLVGK